MTDNEYITPPHHLIENLRIQSKRKIFWGKDLLKGAPLKNALEEVRSVAEFKQIEITEKLISDILNFASENTLYYRDYKGVPLNSYPVTNKKIYLDHYKEFEVPLENIPNQKDKVHIQKTSGSTGIPFAVPQDTQCRLRRVAVIKYENEKIGFKTCDPLLHLRAVSHYWGSDKELYNKANNIWYCDNSDLDSGKLESIFNLINSRKIRFIRGYMTTLDLLTRFMVENGLNFKYKPFFISVGEPLKIPLRDRVVTDLDCKIVSQYGNEENGVFGTSPINGNGREIILNNSSTIIELFKINSNDPITTPNEIGRIVVTDFSNFAFPMIRYDIGDLASASQLNENGWVVKLDNLIGRKSDLIYRTDGTIIDFYNSIPEQIFNNPNLLQWQFIQEGEKKYKLILNLKEKGRYNKDEYEKSIKNLLGQDGDIEIILVDKIPILQSGKFRPVLNNWKSL